VFAELEKINARPEPFEFYTASDLWTDEHTSKQMLMVYNWLQYFHISTLKAERRRQCFTKEMKADTGRCYRGSS
jgi:hypothetical protein